MKWVPTLLVWGDRDCTVSLASAIKLNHKLPASELVVLAGGGHSVFEEAPEESTRIMLDWLGRHSLSYPHLRDLSCGPAVARAARGTAGMRRLSPGI